MLWRQFPPLEINLYNGVRLTLLMSRCGALRCQRRLAGRGRGGEAQFYRTVDVHDDATGLELESNSAGRYRSPSLFPEDGEGPFERVDTPEKVR